MTPTPRKHKDLDSFLVPLIAELKELSTRVQDVYNKHTSSQFTLHGDLVLVSADGPASADASGLKNPGNAKTPCHQCYIPGTRAENGHYCWDHRVIYVYRTSKDSKSKWFYSLLLFLEELCSEGWNRGWR